MDLTQFAAWVRAEATGWDQLGRLPEHAVKAVAGQGLLGIDVAEEHGGHGGTPFDLGEACAQLGAVCSAVRGLVTVQGMVAAALARWGTVSQRELWLPALAHGEHVAGFAATEQEAGTDLTAVSTVIEPAGPMVTVTGAKRWVTCGQSATVFLVLGVLDGLPATVLVESDRQGVVVEPVRDQLGMRAAGIAHVRFGSVRAPKDNLVAPKGFGLSHVAATALDHGRFTVGWGCVGMAEACLDDAAAHAVRRTQNGVALAEHQLVRSMLARATVDTDAARRQCLAAAKARQDGEPDAIAKTVIAKYAAARTAAAVSSDAVQILGSAGCDPGSRAGRFYRDAKVMQIIEGAEQVSELHIADHLLRRYRRNQ
jgi:methoxymalonate biosynthesis protein